MGLEDPGAVVIELVNTAITVATVLGTKGPCVGECKVLGVHVGSIKIFVDPTGIYGT